MVCPHLKNCIQFWSPYLKKGQSRNSGYSEKEVISNQRPVKTSERAGTPHITLARRNMTAIYKSNMTEWELLFTFICKFIMKFKGNKFKRKKCFHFR